MSDYVQVSTATPNREQAIALAQSAVAARLAGNAQVIGPVTSVFWHDGQQGIGEEYQVVLYTATRRYDALQAHLLEHHPWDNPQITAVPIGRAPQAYREWMDGSVLDTAEMPD